MAANPLRTARLARGGAWVMVPLDHGISMGPVPGLEDPRAALSAAAAGGATCVTLHKGLVPLAATVAGRLGVMLHLSASSDFGPDSHDKRLVATVEEALRLGCDGVSIHVNVGAASEAHQLEDAGTVAAACAEWGVPLLTMAYPRGPTVADPRDPKLLAHAARLAAELGADAVKVPYSGSPDTFRDVVRGCPVPVLVAGGASRGLDDLVADLKGAKKAGAAGASIGRNVFQAKDPAAAVRAIASVFGA